MNGWIATTSSGMAADARAMPCRMVTPEDVAHCSEFGWVRLRKFMEPALLAEILAIARSRIGDDGDGNDPYGKEIACFNAGYGGGLSVSRSALRPPSSTRTREEPSPCPLPTSPRSSMS